MSRHEEKYECAGCGKTTQGEILCDDCQLEEDSGDGEPKTELPVCEICGELNDDGFDVCGECEREQAEDEPQEPFEDFEETQK